MIKIVIFETKIDIQDMKIVILKHKLAMEFFNLCLEFFQNCAFRHDFFPDPLSHPLVTWVLLQNTPGWESNFIFYLPLLKSFLINIIKIWQNIVFCKRTHYSKSVYQCIYILNETNNYKNMKVICFHFSHTHI